MTSTTTSPIVTAARHYINTPFRHQGRSVHGLDCLGLLVCIARDLQLCDSNGTKLHRADRLDYGKRPDGDALMRTLDTLLVRTEHLTDGVVTIFSLDHNPQHLGIITTYCHGGLGLLHAYAPARKVVEHRLDDAWQRRIIARYHPPAII